MKISDPLMVIGGHFRIKYDCTGDFCQAYPFKISDKIPNPFMNSANPIADETIVYGAGSYYIQANTIGVFTMTVEDHR